MRQRPNRPLAADAARTPEPETSVEFAMATRRFLQDQITLADSKAAVVLTMSIMIVAYLVRSGGGPGWHGPPSTWGLEGTLALGALLALGAGVLGALAVVVPRYAGRAEGYVFWQAVLMHEAPRDYADAILGLDARALEATLLEDCHRLSSICARKFRVLRLTMWSASLGLLLGLIRVILF